MVAQGAYVRVVVLCVWSCVRQDWHAASIGRQDGAVLAEAPELSAIHRTTVESLYVLGVRRGRETAPGLMAALAE